MSEMQSYIERNLANAIIMAQEQIFQVIDSFVKEYYAEYTPVEYHRTYQFYKSLVKSEIIRTSKGYETHVYFDASNLNYLDWSGEKVIESAMLGKIGRGSHGGWIDGTHVWEDSMNILNSEAIAILKRTLIANGIPVK